jgi:amino acid transporter
VFGAAAGAIGTALFGWPPIVGVLALMIGIAFFTALGSESVEQLFKYVTIFLYCVYALFLILALAKFPHLVRTGFAKPHSIDGWAVGGANGYRVLSYVFLLIYVVPIMTYGAWRLFRGRKESFTASVREGDWPASENHGTVSASPAIARSDAR